MPLIANQKLAETNPHREQVKKMIIAIREEINTKIRKVKWVDDEMKIFLEEKLRSMKFFIGGKLDGSEFHIDYGQNVRLIHYFLCFPLKLEIFRF